MAKVCPQRNYFSGDLSDIGEGHLDNSHIGKKKNEVTLPKVVA
jgi:hypothetical protein